MPFTFSHPALVLPLSKISKKYFSLTGLIIGSIIPDFEYFIRMKMFSNLSHTIHGIFIFDLPLAIIVSFIFHNIVKKPLVNNLPAFLKSRFYKMSQFNWNQYFKKNWHIVLISILIGIISHLIWDNFTHKDRFFVQLFPVLQNNVLLFGKNIPIYNIVQHSSNILGIIIVVLFIITLPKRDFSDYGIKTKLIYWSLVIVLTISITFIRFAFSSELLIKIGDVIGTLISACIISLIIVSLFFRESNISHSRTV